MDTVIVELKNMCQAFDGDGFISFLKHPPSRFRMSKYEGLARRKPVYS